jgi:hypothetical protein
MGGDLKERKRYRYPVPSYLKRKPVTSAQTALPVHQDSTTSVYLIPTTRHFHFNGPAIATAGTMTTMTVMMMIIGAGFMNV